MSDKTLDRVLTLELVRVTERAAVAASYLIGRGNEKEADQAAVDAMRTELNQLNIDKLRNKILLKVLPLKV